MNFRLAVALAAGLGMSACEDFNRPISSSEFDPMRSPAMRPTAPPAMDDGFQPGQFVSAIMDNTAFFSKKPEGNAEADRLLPRGTSMKVVAASGSYSKVELDSGEVGFVPSIMLEDPNAPVGMDFEGGNPYEVYPLDGEFDTLPELPAGGSPPSGAVPTLIDPNAPAGSLPNPGIDTLPTLPPAGAETPDDGKPSELPAGENPTTPPTAE